MANVSDTSVRIQAKGCAKEVKEWLKAVDKEAYYDACDDHTGTPCPDLGENSADFCGVANGRWTYEANAEGLFGDEEQRKSWAGEERWLAVQAAYNAVLLALKDDPEAYVQVDYTEYEVGCDFMGEGSVSLQYDTGAKQVETVMSYHHLGRVSPDKLVDYGFYENTVEAKEALDIEE